MHRNRAYADPAGQAGKQAGKVTRCMQLKPDGRRPKSARSQPVRHEQERRGEKTREIKRQGKKETQRVEVKE